ncbi:MAG: hypothetical protein R6V53_04380 [Candidatus Woesearchaeota archaeon]
MAKAKKKSVTKAKKKKWFQIIAPKLFMEQSLGETPAVEINDLMNKKLTVNMMSLTRDPKKQGVAATFTINGIRDGQATTALTGYRIVPTTIKRMVRRGKDRLDQTLKLKTKDKCIVEIKTILLTRGTTTSSVQVALHHKVREVLKKDIAKVEYDELVKQITQSKLQKGVFSKLKKIHPVAIFEIRGMQLLTDVTSLPSNAETDKAEPTKTDSKDKEETSKAEPTKADSKDKEEAAKAEPKPKTEKAAKKDKTDGQE